MYDFTKLDGVASPNYNTSYGVIFNGIDLEESIPGFKTLIVNGRGVLGRDISTINAQGRDGSILESSTLPSRLLQIKYSLESDNSTNTRKSLERLNAILYENKEVSIMFKDDLTNYYEGTLADTTTEDEDSNIIQGQLIFICPTPFKYSTPIVKSGTSVIYNNYDGDYKIDAGIIGLYANFTFTSTVTAPNVQLKNSLGQSIEIGPVSSGRTYRIVLKPKTIIYENGIKKMKLLKITPMVEIFKILPGISFNLSTGGQLSTEFKVVRL